MRNSEPPRQADAETNALDILSNPLYRSLSQVASGLCIPLLQMRLITKPTPMFTVKLQCKLSSISFLCWELPGFGKVSFSEHHNPYNSEFFQKCMDATAGGDIIEKSWWRTIYCSTIATTSEDISVLHSFHSVGTYKYS